MKYLLLLFSIPFQGQVLHHQMLSSQGTTNQISGGIVVRQSIGQQSIIGNSTNNNSTVMQGFQQSLWGQYIASNLAIVDDGIKIVTYPNPFTETIHFQFSKSITEEVSIFVFDVLGRLIYQKKEKVDNAILTVDLAALPTSEYLVRLNTPNLNHYTKIIKK